MSHSIGRRVVPSLLVRDLAETLDFYQRIGFQQTASYPENSTPVWTEVERDGVTLQFYTEPPVGTPSEPICSGTFYLFPDSVLELAEELRDVVEFAWGPEVMDYGMRELAIQDPNGYLLAFAEPA